MGKGVVNARQARAHAGRRSVKAATKAGRHRELQGGWAAGGGSSSSMCGEPAGSGQKATCARGRASSRGRG